jgi:hypothetical protein
LFRMDRFANADNARPASVAGPVRTRMEPQEGGRPDAHRRGVRTTVRRRRHRGASHVEMFRIGLEVVDNLTDEQRQWAEESGFARMQEALGTVSFGTFGGQVFDKAHCLRVFEEHYARVRRIVPAERLLVYRVQDGWEPLCRFLGADVPDEPFPRVNVGNDLVHNIHTAMRLARAQSGQAVWR